MAVTTPGGFSDHSREGRGYRLIYPVLSRRSGGLSLGINLFPDAKACSFACPYCEVLSFQASAPFSLEELHAELLAYVEAWTPDLGPIKDLSFSGNGEPSLSPHLGPALDLCADLRRKHPQVLGGTKLVIITNSTGFLQPRIRALLAHYVAAEGLEVWAKLDAGDQGLFEAMSASKFRLEAILEGILAFAQTSPIVLQTMVCALEGPSGSPAGPTPVQLKAYAQAVAALVASGACIREIHLYTQARPAQAPITSALADADLLTAARQIQAGCGHPCLRVFGSQGELSL